MTQGYIKLHRKILENPICMKDADHFALWTYILLQCTHTEVSMIFDGKKITLLPGQFITGRDKISKDLKINRSKVERILKRFCSKSEQQLEQQTTRHGRLITVLNWDAYQTSEQQNGQQVSNKRATSEQQVSTNKNDNNVKNDNNINNINNPKPTVSVSASYKAFVDLFNEITGKKFRYGDKKASNQLQARLKEGYTREDIEKAIRNCFKDPYHMENPKYLTPEFITRTSKLEMYLEATESPHTGVIQASKLSFGAQEELLKMKRKAEREAEMAKIEAKYQQPISIENTEK